ncbi:2-hydroxyacid dehydrogenase-like protein [Bisporella sp. PMI_857]|nr:2-hydroxyacid dehydrogenase-like protein [Bisporella sp. PMI_857]
MMDQKPISIIRLDAAVGGGNPTFTFPHTYIPHPDTPKSDPAVISALQSVSADVVITTRVPITAGVLAACPSLKLVAVWAIGSDHIDLAACKEKGVRVCNIPAASNEAVAEHAISLYFSLRRRIVYLHELTRAGKEWVSRGSLAGEFGGKIPGTAREEVLSVFGAGELGNRVANIGRALGMEVIFAERKGVPASEVREGRTEFTEAIRISTVLVLTLPLAPSTLNLISTPELDLMRPDALLINVARGGIVDEDALVEALKAGKLGGVATDVFAVEPADKDNVLVKAAGEDWSRGRLVLTPHLAWFAQSSIKKLERVTEENIEGWLKGDLRNVVL